jgi:hypothetical protein
MPTKGASAKKDANRIAEIRFGMVMVKVSITAANVRHIGKMVMMTLAVMIRFTP